MMRPVPLRPVTAAVAVLLAGACAGPDPSDGARDTTTGEHDVQPDSTDEPTAAATPPDGDRPLELASQRPATPLPAPREGVPVGTDGALFPGRVDGGLDAFVRTAASDLADRLGVDPAAITTVSATLVTWPDASTGCPQPGMSYAQVLQDGSLIELGHGGRVFRYHTGGDRTSPFLCDPPSDVRPTSVD